MVTSPPHADKVRADSPRPRPAPHVGEILVTRGRHAGKRLADCPADFLAWLVANSTCSTYRLAAAELLGLRPGAAAPPPPAEPAETRPRLNLSQWFDTPGAYALEFGRFRGRRLDQLPDEYLRYVAAESWEPDLKELAERVLAQRAGVDEGDPLQVAPPSDARAADVLPRLAFDFEQRLRARWWLDTPEEARVIDRAVEVLHELASAYTGRRRPTADELARAAAEGL